MLLLLLKRRLHIDHQPSLKVHLILFAKEAGRAKVIKDDGSGRVLLFALRPLNSLSLFRTPEDYNEDQLFGLCKAQLFIV